MPKEKEENEKMSAWYLARSCCTATTRGVHLWESPTAVARSDTNPTYDTAST